MLLLSPAHSQGIARTKRLGSACRVLSRPFVRLHSSDDLAVGGKISELFQVVQQCLEGGMSAVLSCSAAAVRISYRALASLQPNILTICGVLLISDL